MAAHAGLAWSGHTEHLVESLSLEINDRQKMEVAEGSLAGRYRSHRGIIKKEKK